MRIRFGWIIFLLGSVAWAGSGWEAHFSQGETLQRNGQYQQAAIEFENALQEAQRDNTEDDVRLPVTWNNLGVVYSALARTREAEGCYLRTIAFYENKPVFGVPLATTLDNLGALYVTLGRLSKAEPLYRRSLEIRRSVLPANDPAAAQSWQGLARLEQERHHGDEAEEYYRQALAIEELAFGFASLRIAPLVHNLATLLTETGRFDDARPLYDRALMIYRSASPDNPAQAIVLRHLAELDARTGATSRADAEFQEALTICDRALPPDHPQTGIILQAYGRFLKESKRRREADATTARANRILVNAMRDSGSGWAVDAASLRGR